LFVTFRLADSIPRSTLRLYYSQKKWLEEETKRILRLKLREDSPETAAHEKRLQDFRRQWFVKFEDILHKAESGPTWLNNSAVAEIVAEALHHRDGNVYRLDTYCIMPNHVHMVFAPFLSEAELREILLPEGLSFVSRNQPLNVIMQSLKGWTAWRSNRALDRKGTFWQRESYDHVVRDDVEFCRIVKYVLNNPVKAGLVKEGLEWKWSYRHENLPSSV
jgi:REP element-mobilizing transposase RayT